MATIKDEQNKPILDHAGAEIKTRPPERAEERVREEEVWRPVIIKRIDQTRRHPDDMLQLAIDEGLEQLERPKLSLGLSAVAAGMVVSVSAMAVAVATESLLPLDQPMLTRLGTALLYPLGFILCIMGGTELFTEHTAMAVYPAVDGRASWARVLRLWSIVLGGNLVGTLIGSLLLTQVAPVLHADEGTRVVAEHLVGYALPTTFWSALLAGWLMALTGWLILSTPPSASDIFFIYVGTFLIGIGGLHHSIVGSAELFVALLQGASIAWSTWVPRLLAMIVGNLLGGSVFVAWLNYAQIRQTKQGATS